MDGTQVPEAGCRSTRAQTYSRLDPSLVGLSEHTSSAVSFSPKMKQARNPLTDWNPLDPVGGGREKPGHKGRRSRAVQQPGPRGPLATPGEPRGRWDARQRGRQGAGPSWHVFLLPSSSSARRCRWGVWKPPPNPHLARLLPGTPGGGHTCSTPFASLRGDPHNPETLCPTFSPPFPYRGEPGVWGRGGFRAPSWWGRAPGNLDSGRGLEAEPLLALGSATGLMPPL